MRWSNQVWEGFVLMSVVSHLLFSLLQATLISTNSCCNLTFPIFKWLLQNKRWSRCRCLLSLTLTVPLCPDFHSWFQLSLKWHKIDMAIEHLGLYIPMRLLRWPPPPLHVWWRHGEICHQIRFPSLLTHLSVMHLKVRSFIDTGPWFSQRFTLIYSWVFEIFCWKIDSI